MCHRYKAKNSCSGDEIRLHTDLDLGPSRVHPHQSIAAIPTLLKVGATLSPPFFPIPANRKPIQWRNLSPRCFTFRPSIVFPTAAATNESHCRRYSEPWIILNKRPHD